MIFIRETKRHDVGIVIIFSLMIIYLILGLQCRQYSQWSHSQYEHWSVSWSTVWIWWINWIEIRLCMIMTNWESHLNLWSSIFFHFSHVFHNVCHGFDWTRIACMREQLTVTEEKKTYAADGQAALWRIQMSSISFESKMFS